MASAPFSSAAVATPLRVINGCQRTVYNVDFCHQRYAKRSLSLQTHLSVFRQRHTPLSNVLISSKIKNQFCVCFADQLRTNFLNITSASKQTEKDGMPEHEQRGLSDLVDTSGSQGKVVGPKTFKNMFGDFARLGSVVNNAAESFFKSEIRRRLFVTAALLIVSRIGYFIPLPGFDRRLIPQNYLSFVAGSSDELGDCAPELKMSFFQLGISPQIAASILMQVLCHVVPSLIKLRKEGLDAQEKIKSYIVKHVMVTTLFLVFGAMTMTWICDKISESGFGQGSSLVVCLGILTGYTDTLYKMLSLFSGSVLRWGPYALGILGIFTTVTMGAVLVTEGCRKIKLQYYSFKLASRTRKDAPMTEVEPYIPFNINPSGMQPLLTTSYLLAFPSILASLLGSPFWEHVREILNPETSVGAEPWVYYAIYAFCVFLFNIFDIANMPKEIAEYLNKMGARIPRIKPGKATVEYLAKIQASTRFWGGLLLSILATSSSILDRHLRSINESYAIGFTSILIIVGSIIELRRSYQAYNVMPSLSKALNRYGA